jgi:hypothetical protein
VQQLAAKMTPEQRRQAATGTLPKKPATPAAPPTPAAAPAPVADAAPAPGTTADPASTTETSAAPAATNDTPPAGNPAEDAGGDKGPNRFRFSREEDQAVALFAKTHNISLIEAGQRLSAATAPAATPSTPAEPQPDPELTAVETRLTDANKRIGELIAARKKATEDLDHEKANELTDEIATLKASAVILDHEKKGLIQLREQEAASSAQEQINASRDRAFAEYPDLANPKSRDRLALNSYINAAKADPTRKALFTRPDWPETLVKEFATEYSIAPKTAAGTAPAAPTPVAATPAPGPLRKPAPVQAAATPSGARLLTSADGQAPGAPKPLSMDEVRAKLKANPKLGMQVLKHIGELKQRS